MEWMSFSAPILIVISDCALAIDGAAIMAAPAFMNVRRLIRTMPLAPHSTDTVWGSKKHAAGVVVPAIREEMKDKLASPRKSQYRWPSQPPLPRRESL